ncbi:MAG: phloretin hydrolase [Parasporobacterium sp.]|nr:phloretin hydrolase [Parasporobacterium sp.]
MALVPVAKDAKDKQYYKYYEQGIAAVSKEDLSIISNSKGTVEECLEIEDRNKLLEPGILPENLGYYPTKDGGLLVAGNIPMPDVSADMLYWWFAWHGLDPLRYAIWDPEDHYGLELNEEGKRRAVDKSIPIPERNWGATHTVQESIGGPPDEIVIMFKNPKEMGYDMTKVGTKDCEFMVSANALLGSMKVPVVMTEIAKKVDGVMTFSARFWVGYHIIDGKAQCLVPISKVLPPEEVDKVAQGLLAHNIKEFSNLNKILPSVYAENKDLW